MLTIPSTHTFEQLAKVKIEKANTLAEGGVRHFDLLHEVGTALRKLNREPRKAGYQISITRFGQDMIAALKIHADDMSNQYLGLVASNSKYYYLRMYAGGVWNGVPVVMKRFGGRKFPGWRYDESFRLQDVAEEIASLWDKEADKLPTFARELSEKKVNNSHFRAILCSAADRGIVSWPKAGHVWKEWKRIDNRSPETALRVLHCFAMHPCGRSMENLDNQYKITKMILGKEKVAT